MFAFCIEVSREVPQNHNEQKRKRCRFNPTAFPLYSPPRGGGGPRPPPYFTPPPPSPFCGFLAVVSFAFVKVTYDIRQVLSRSKPLDLVSLENIICCEDPTGSESIFPYPTIVEYKTLSSKSKRRAYFACRLNFC